ncbi:transport permease protein [Ktedonobacter sp. SOSP1-52]|uniref:ABC transporter permease n=1 Tax=Ktedonobacter sp. SOSP1-52 TaxID=2778366 RepID=UPI001916AFCB|nr:ABC transporter permease [Ktedonobacter sp. SOSP1-52]GHO65896.1 transport permease protein [Ktedonobacter sp. SOSP1-52]
MAVQTQKHINPSASGSNRATSSLRQVLQQTKYELLLTSRRGENVLVTLIIPVMLLVFFASLNIVPGVKGSAVNFLLPGVLAVAIIAAGMVNLGIATAYERYYGVLKRLGSSPLSRGGLIVAKVISILALELVQVILLVGVAVLLYGWHPLGSLPLALLFIILGTITFSALGLAMAGALRAELTLAGANGLFLLFLLIGGGILPLDHLPAPIAAVSRFLPSTALTQALQSTLTDSNAFPGFQLLILAIWAVVILLVAIRTFKWE